jgi:hypothetical protein
MAPFLVAGLILPLSQEVLIGGFHLQLLRLLILAGWVRMVWAGFLTGQDPFPGPLSSIDKAVLLWACTSALTFTILWGAVGALIVKLGFLWTALGCYFLLRYLIRDRDDVVRAIKLLAIVCTVIAPLMLVEHVTGRNQFATLGLRLFSELRNGKVRAQGPFAHSIIAGTFGSMLLPLFIGVWWQGKGHRVAAGLGALSSSAIMLSSSSSTPMMTYLAGILGLCFWPFRKSMRAFRWGLVVSLILLQMVMKAPVWFLINRVSGLTGGTGFHRSELIDQFIRHFWEWCLIGTTRNAYWGLDMWDSINAFVNTGLEGGLITFILFISLLTYAYKRIGMATKLAAEDRRNARLIWALGATLFANTVAFFGITYFDQSAVAWYAVLVMISAATASLVDTRSAQTKIEPVFVAVELALPESGYLTTLEQRRNQDARKEVSDA